MGLMFITDFKNDILDSSQSNHISRSFNYGKCTQWIALGVRLLLEFLDDDITVVKEIRVGFSDHLMRLDTSNCCRLNPVIFSFPVDDHGTNIYAFDGHLP